MSEADSSGSGYEGAPGMGPIPEMGPVPGQPPEVIPEQENVDLNRPELPPAPTTSDEALHEALLSNYHALQDRLVVNPTPTPDEMAIGVFLEEVQPQARDAVMQLRAKGYDIGNILHAGFLPDNHDMQRMTLSTPLSPLEKSALEKNGFVIEGEQLTFQPDDSTDLGSIKSTWDRLASMLPDRGEPLGPAMFGNAVAFREAAENDTLLDFYMPNGQLDMVGTKYMRERDPWAGSELFLSPDAVSATRELTFIDQYHELKERLEINPTPTEEEMNMGAYKEEIEPQVRDAAITMRRKGYNTGSSGFWGHDHAEQVMAVHTPIDDSTKARLAEHMVVVRDDTIRFMPDNPSDMESVKATWDTIADILPDLGKHADASESMGADEFRYAAKHGLYDNYLESWIWQTGALHGHMPPLTITLVNEGRDFGPDVFAAGREAEARHQEMMAEIAREHIAEQQKDSR